MKLNNYPAPQQGVVLMLLLAVIVIMASTVFLSVANSKIQNLPAQNEVRYQMQQAKAALLAYATNYDDFYYDGESSGYIYDQGPGRFPCPDTSNNGSPNTGCTSDTRGRLPESVTLPDGTTFKFNDTYAGIDEQFWYAVTRDFSENRDRALHTSKTGDLTLDGVDDIVAVIIAPGIAHSSQDRSSGPTSAANYLEGGNVNTRDYINFYAADPDNFNDQVLAITTNEVHTLMTIKLTQRIKWWLDYANDCCWSMYPPNDASPSQDFEWLMGIYSDSPWEFYRWWANDEWVSRVTYARDGANNDVATIVYDNCGITFTIDFNGGITRDQPRC